MKKILFVMPALNSGGAEKSLINLLNIIDNKKYDIDLLLLKKEGIFLEQVPAYVNILDTSNTLKYAYKLDKKLFSSLSGIKSGFLRIVSTGFCKLVYKENNRQQRWIKFYKKYLPTLEETYDIAIGFLEGDASYFVIDKVKAKKKILWIHNDFNEIKKSEDQYYYAEYFNQANQVISISDKCVQILADNYPNMKDKFFCLPNLTSSSLLNELSKGSIEEKFDKNEFNVLSIGRLTKQKGYDLAIEALKILKDENISIHWWVIGAGELEGQLKKKVEDSGLEKHFTFLGLRKNPYPYIKNCDLLAQTSRWEGKSVVLDEAKILAKPVLATNYSTIKDQLIDKKEGLIVDMNSEAIASGIKLLMENKQLLTNIQHYLSSNNYGNENEINKYYELFDN